MLSQKVTLQSRVSTKQKFQYPTRSVHVTITYHVRVEVFPLISHSLPSISEIRHPGDCFRVPQVEKK